MSFSDWRKHLYRRSVWLTSALLIALLLGLAGTPTTFQVATAASGTNPAGNYEPTECERRVAKCASC